MADTTGQPLTSTFIEFTDYIQYTFLRITCKYQTRQYKASTLFDLPRSTVAKDEFSVHCNPLLQTKIKNQTDF